MNSEKIAADLPEPVGYRVRLSERGNHPWGPTIWWLHEIRTPLPGPSNFYDVEYVYTADQVREAIEADRKAMANMAAIVRGSQQQCDEDGQMIAVSRQALDELLTMIDADRNARENDTRDAERFRAAPAGGDVPVGVIGELGGKVIVLYSQDEIGHLPKGTKLYTRPKDSAPAGSGEVAPQLEMVKAYVRLYSQLTGHSIVVGLLNDYATLLRKLQQGVDSRWNAVGGDLPLDREEAGIVFDALMEHAASATKRKGVNAASNSDVRAEMCHRVMDRIRGLCAASQGQEADNARD